MTWTPTLAELDALRDALMRAGGATLDLSLGETRLVMEPALVAAADPAPGAPAPEAAPAPATLDADGTGLLHLSDPAGGKPFALVGAPVDAGQIIAVLRAGKALFPVRASRAGTVASALHPDGTLVGYGTPLFTLAPD